MLCVFNGSINLIDFPNIIIVLFQIYVILFVYSPNKFHYSLNNYLLSLFTSVNQQCYSSFCEIKYKRSLLFAGVSVCNEVNPSMHVVLHEYRYRTIDGKIL